MKKMTNLSENFSESIRGSNNLKKLEEMLMTQIQTFPHTLNQLGVLEESRTLLLKELTSIASLWALHFKMELQLPKAAIANKFTAQIAQTLFQVLH